jgi:hypothetical protein
MDTKIKKLFELHNKLAGAFLSLCSDCKKVESYVHPHNYLPNVIALKNTYLHGFKREELKGCCMFEPIARIHNLVSTFPYTTLISQEKSKKIDNLWKSSKLSGKDVNTFVEELEDIINKTIKLLN